MGEGNGHCDRELSITDILSADDLPIHRVDIPQWKGHLYVRCMRADERSEIERQFSKKKPSDDPIAFRRAVLMSTVTNSKGVLMLDTPDVAAQFMKKNAEAVETAFEESCKYNGFRKKDVEDLEKNLPQR